MGGGVTNIHNLLSVTQKVFVDDPLHTDPEYDGWMDFKDVLVFTIFMNSFIFCTFFHLSFFRIYYPKYFLKKNYSNSFMPTLQYSWIAFFDDFNCVCVFVCVCVCVCSHLCTLSVINIWLYTDLVAPRELSAPILVPIILNLSICEKCLDNTS